MFDAEGLSARARERFGGAITDSRVQTGEVTLVVQAGDLRPVCLALRDEPDFDFRQLVDLCAVDYSAYGQVDWETSETVTGTGFSRGVQARAPGSGSGTERFAVVYHLLSHRLNQRVRLRVYAEGEPPRIESVTDIWPSANWFEREAFDLFGVLFEGHPDLRRLLTDYGFVGHPFRKDFPLIGEVEMRYDPDKRRVVYEPVSIEPRTLVPRVIRHDERYSGRAPAGASGAPDGKGED